MEVVAKFSCRLQCFIGGLWYIKVEYVKTGEGDYSKWLGPDWKPEFDGASAIVPNHVCWMDICSVISLVFPRFIGKTSVKNYPIIGSIGVAMNSFFIDGGSSKEDKKAALFSISAEQEKIDKIGGKPLLIFPEGATTNNEQVI